MFAIRALWGASINSTGSLTREARKQFIKEKSNVEEDSYSYFFYFKENNHK